MPTKMKTVKATCLCGDAQHFITLPETDFPLQADFCHCESCRRTIGTLDFPAAALPKSYTGPGPNVIEKLIAFPFSEHLIYYSCSRCGATVLETDGSGEWGVAPGTLEKADGIFQFKSHGFIADTIDGGSSDFFNEADGRELDRWSRKRGVGEQLPLFWQSPDRPIVKPAASDKLHAHCKCGGINFWIARPSERSALGQAGCPDVLLSHKDAPKPTEDSAWWIRCNGTKFLAGFCSCDSCRLASGMEWVQWAFIPTVDITLDSEGRVPFSLDFGTLKSYHSSEEATRYFCKSCGAMVFWDGVSRNGGVIDVAVGLLDAPEGARAESWLEWRTARLSYREDALPRARANTLALEDGMRVFGERKLGGVVHAVAS